jgi:pimeloyl-ACP methyl ester carboxylesterase
MISKTLDLGGESVHYADFGGTGPTFVLVHGLGGSHANWLALAPRLAKLGRVVAIDLPGFGRSAWSAAGTSMEVLSRALAQFMDAMSPKEPVHLVGNSMGGMLSVLEGHARPERVASALLVCPALPPPRGAKSDPLWMRMLFIACVPWGYLVLRRGGRRVGPEKLTRQLLALCCVDPSKVPADVVEAHIALAIERAKKPWGEHAFAQATRSLLVLLVFGKRLRTALRELTPPTLIVHGDKDRLVDINASRAVVKRNPRIALEELPNLGHTPQLEAADVVMAAAAPWLNRVL